MSQRQADDGGGALRPRPLIRLAARDLACIRGGREVFSGVSFELAAGEALMLTGPNGSGKSTLLRLVAGLLPVSGGSLTCGDHRAGEAGVSETVHYVGHLDAVKPALTVRETLDFWVTLFDGHRQDVDMGLARLALTPLADLPAGLLSAGQKRRLALARLMLGARPLWLLDEPTVSLDRDSEQALGGMIEAHLAAGGLALIASHTPMPLPGARALRLGSESGGL